VLLLVLILVLIAFGLLVVALLSGSVLWAWVSVGVSVAAAAVLLVDWMQRRSAVRAGAEAGDAVPTPAAAPVPPPHTPGSAVEPATEVFPAVSADGPSHDEAAASGAERVPDGRRDERPDTRETVVMRAFGPSGSTEQPSGADGGIAPSGPISSHSVTDGGAAGGGPAAWGTAPGPSREGDGGSSDVDPDSETVKVAGTPGREPGARDAQQGGPQQGGAQQGGPQQGGPQHGAPQHGGSPYGGSPYDGAQHDGPQHGGPQHGAPDRGAVGSAAPTTRQDLPPLGPDGAPPEEPHDGDAAALVAGLDDEVLVVDELPRYHVNGCPSLGNSPVIPLPAREAVELGFTPCAWCAPDRTLAGRHRAPVR
jgi:hypothetical protein